MADVVKAEVLTGDYATESEVIRDGLRALISRLLLPSGITNYKKSAVIAFDVDADQVSIVACFTAANPVGQQGRQVRACCSPKGLQHQVLLHISCTLQQLGNRSRNIG